MSKKGVIKHGREKHQEGDKKAKAAKKTEISPNNLNEGLQTTLIEM